MTHLQLRLRVLGLCLRKKLFHEDIRGVFGFQSSSWPAHYKITQIAREEVSSEVRLMQALLPTTMSKHLGVGFASQPPYRFLRESAAHLLEMSWVQFLRGLKTRMAQHPKLQLEPPSNISKVKLSQATEAFLSQGPKFAPELPVSRVDNLAAVHEVASKIPEANRQDFVSAGSRTVRFHGGGSTTGNMARTVIEEFRQADLGLLEADKEGIFVVLDRDQLDQKTSAALCKNFRPLRARPSGSLRSEAKALCDSLNLPSLKSLISLPSQQYLSIFFSAKTHKPDIPHRSIISEKGCWQRPLALFLQKQLSVLDLPHPFRIDNSSALIKPLEELHSAQNTVAVFSLDIVDMYYSLDNPTMLCFISEAIHLHGAVRFQNSAGISVSGFLDLVDLYLRSTLEEHEGRIFAQKTGVCIGSCLAPILSEIYLFFVDRRVSEALTTLAQGTSVFRYVDDYLIVHQATSDPKNIEQIFSDNSFGLKFTSEAPTQNGLQFLDLRLHPSDSGICWSFQQRSCKPVLPFHSNHSKNVKSGIVHNLLTSSRSKSCSHLISTSCSLQLTRLVKACYPKDLLETRLKRIMAAQASGTQPKSRPRASRFACIPYVHNVSHRIKSLALRHDTQVFFSCRLRLSSLCRKVNNPTAPKPCPKKHATKFVPCRQASVYSIPLGCGAQYIGQTGRCLNDRLREHANEVQQAASNPSLHSQHPIAQHVGSCPSCEPVFSATTTVGTHRSRYGREIIEAFAMRHSPQNIGSPSLCLSDADVSFLRPELRQT
ncbi:uncharacterized protein ISCGN_018354 [Ixodes scapularis]